MGDTEKLKEFEGLCRPVVEWLRKNHNPHTTVVITDVRAELYSKEMGVPYEIED